MSRVNPFFNHHFLLLPATQSAQRLDGPIYISPRDLENYHNLLSKNLPTFPPEVVNCSNVDCKVHYEAIDSFTQLFVSTLLSCSFQCFPCSTPSSTCKLAGWNDGMH